MFLGHPILDEIRQGRQLRPTKTIDKSKPILIAEGETFSKDLSRANLYNNNNNDTADSTVIAVKPPPLPTMPPPPPPLPVSQKVSPKPITKPALLKLGGKQNVDRDELMRSIKSGVRLRKATTIDKSAPIIHADIESQDILPPPLHQKFNSCTSTGSSESELSKNNENNDSQENSSAMETTANVYKPPAEVNMSNDYTPQFNTLPKMQSQQPNRLPSNDAFTLNNGTMPRVKKADECYTSPIPTREMIEAEIPTGSAANKIKLLNSLHSCTQSQNPTRTLMRPTISRNQMQSGALAKFAAATLNQDKSDIKTDENTAPMFKPPLQGNPVSKSNSMNSIKKMAQRFDSNAISTQQNSQPRRLWKASSVNSSASAIFANKFNQADKVFEKKESLDNKPVFTAFKPLDKASKETNGFKPPQPSNGTIRSQVEKFEVGQKSVKKDDSFSTIQNPNQRETDNCQFTRPFENGVAPSCSAIKDEERHPKVFSTELWKRELEKYPAVATISSFTNQPKRLSNENLRTTSQISPGSRSVTQESSGRKLEIPKQQRSVSSENLSQYTYEPIQFKSPSTKTPSKSSLFKYIVPIEIDTSENPPPVPSSLPPPLSPVVQSGVHRSIVGQNGNSHEHLSTTGSENSGSKPYSSTSFASSYGTTSSRSNNSLDMSPASQPSPVDIIVQSESSPNSSTSLSPRSLNTRLYADSHHSLIGNYNGNSSNEADSELDGRTLLQPAKPFFVAKQNHLSSNGIHSVNPTELERNGNSRWHSHAASRSTPQLDCDSEARRNTGFYSVPVNAPWYNKSMYNESMDRMNNGYDRRSGSSRSSEEIYQHGDSLPAIGRARRIIVGMTGPNLEAFADMDPEVFRDNFKFAIDLNSDNLLRVIPR